MLYLKELDIISTDNSVFERCAKQELESDPIWGDIYGLREKLVTDDTRYLSLKIKKTIND